MLQARGRGWVTHELVLDDNKRYPLLLAGERIDGFSKQLAAEEYEVRFTDARTLGIKRVSRDGWFTATLTAPERPFFCLHQSSPSPGPAQARKAMISLLEAIISESPKGHFGTDNVTDGSWDEIAGALRYICDTRDDPELRLLFAKAFVRRTSWTVNPLIDRIECAVQIAEADPEARAIFMAGPVFSKPLDVLRDTPGLNADMGVRDVQKRLSGGTPPKP